MSFADVRFPDFIGALRENCTAKDSFSGMLLRQGLSHGGQVANI
jgi:hypothetical protein